MCRWFAYISRDESCLLEDVLINPKHSLAKQVHDHYLPKLLPHDEEGNPDVENDVKARNIMFNIDGLGVAWYTSSNTDFEAPNSQDSGATVKEGLRPTLYKSTQPPVHDLNFRSICANTETRVLMAHIRAASGTAITQINCHPFAFGRHCLIHNGAVSDFLEIRRDVCSDMSQAAFANVYGSTDSEHIAGLYMTYLTNGGDVSSFEKEYTLIEMANAMHRAVSTIINLQEKRFGNQKKPNSLNLCATDGVKMIAYRFRNHKTSQPPSLYYSTSAGVTLNRKFVGHADGPDVHNSDLGRAAHEHGEHLIVASEPTTYKESEWNLIGKNQILLAEPNGKFELHNVPYVKTWDSTAT